MRARRCAAFIKWRSVKFRRQLPGARSNGGLEKRLVLTNIS